MKLWLLSHLANSPGNQLILAAAEAQGFDARHVNPAEATLGPGGLSVPGAAELPDAVYTRMGASAPLEALLMLEALEQTGTPCVNRAAGLRLARDKAVSAQILQQAGLAAPATLMLGSRADPVDAATQLGPPPWILKLPISTQGAGVMIVESARSLRSAVDTLRSAGQQILLQAFVAEAAGRDLRVLVVGGKVLAAMRRRAVGDEFRSNLHRGGRSEGAEIDRVSHDLALAAAQAHGLDVAGVDLLETPDGPLVVEVNGSPGLEGLEAASGRPLANEILQWLASRS